MAYDIDRENQRHQAGWEGFVRFTMASAVGVVLTLGLMALFLL